MTRSFDVLGCAIELERRAVGESRDHAVLLRVTTTFRAYLAEVEKRWTNNELAQQFGIGLDKALLSGLADAYGRSDQERGFSSARYFPTAVVFELHEKLKQLIERLEAINRGEHPDRTEYDELVAVLCKIHRPLIGEDYPRPRRFAA